MKTPKSIVEAWVSAFNRVDLDALCEFYSDDAINHQVVDEPLFGKAAIRAMFEREFARAEMICLVENIFEDGD
jgi:ketosteroid isomerase-like protein